MEITDTQKTRGDCEQLCYSILVTHGITLKRQSGSEVTNHRPGCRFEALQQRTSKADPYRGRSDITEPLLSAVWMRGFKLVSRLSHSLASMQSAPSHGLHAHI